MTKKENLVSKAVQAILLSSGLLFFGITSSLESQTQQPLMYGSPINLEQARKVISAAQAEAKKNNWLMAIAIVDTGGNLVLFERLDGTQIGSIEIARLKAVTANNFKRPSKSLEDAIAAGGIGLRLLAIQGIAPLEGGELILLDGKIIGAIGVSGAQSVQDGQVARSGTAALKQ
ncbi:heme-binding protein [Leptospira fluminis]|uniref:Heme-binding protein n=1 Tax=Leptospira fluminis TaxID=2484979 RepID=A0A4R9GNW3_9LEPT|nr:heme-binding protein [Leptospira fluminis]TGK18028.1 heme-binding protein [Leptospira fluminis]